MDPFDSMLRDRFTRLVAVAPGHPGPLPVLPDRTRYPRGVRSHRRDARVPMSMVVKFAMIATLAIVIGGAWLLSMPPIVGPISGAGGEERIVWDSGVVRLEADSVRIETPNGTFRAIDVTPIPDPVSGRANAGWSPTPEEPWYERPRIEHVDFVVRSDSETRYRTLEVTWREAGVEMRLHIYLAADDSHWWATEVRVYDGREEGDWIGWGGSYSLTQEDRRAWPSDDHESRLRAFGVPAGADIMLSGGDPNGITMVVYRDGRGRVHGVGCDGSMSVHVGAREPISWERAPAELCPPPPVDLGLFRSPRGETWTGDLDLVDGLGEASGDAPVSGELHIKGMRLSAFE